MTPTLRELAEETAVYLPARPGGEKVDLGRIWYFAGPREATVQRVRLRAGEVEDAVDEVRAATRERGFERVTWWVGPSATPHDVVERLRAAGLVPDEDAPMLTAMTGTTAPPQVEGVDVRAVTTLDEYLSALEIDWEAFGVPPAERERRRVQDAELWPEMRDRGVAHHYVAYLDGRAVGFGRGMFAPGAVVLLGGAVLPEARGRGVYTALVRARWDAAVARGTPALVVQAGPMSAPILERLGFDSCGTVHLLIDDLTRSRKA